MATLDYVVRQLERVLTPAGSRRWQAAVAQRQQPLAETALAGVSPHVALQEHGTHMQPQRAVLHAGADNGRACDVLDD